MNAKKNDVYYAHHRWKYGSEVEHYELDLIRGNFPCSKIFNPATDMDVEGKTEEEIMEFCLETVLNSSCVVFSSVDGVIGKGVYQEVMKAIEADIPVYYIHGNELYPYKNGPDVLFELEKIWNSVTERVYATVYF